MTGSDLFQNYTLLQFHFHWGENSYQGSEHYVDGYKYPLEVYIFFYLCLFNLIHRINFTQGSFCSSIIRW
jgi:hypothetical protein